MTKAPNGAGSLYKINGGRWRAAKSVPGGKRITGTGGSPTEALARLDVNYKRYLVRQGELPLSSLTRTPKELQLTVEGWAIQWWRTLNPDSVSETVRRQYLSRLELHIIPHIGSTPLRLLTREQCHALIWETLPAKRKPNGDPLLSRASLVNIHRVLSMMLDRAVKDGHITSNPVKAIEAPKKKKRREELQTAWVPAQILKTVQGEPDELRWFLAFLGLRQSEALGLTDDCLKLSRKDRAKLIIKQQLARKDIRHGCGPRGGNGYPCGKKTASGCPEPIGGGGWYIKEHPKTDAGWRTIPIPSLIYPVAVAHIKRQKELRASSEFKPLTGMETLVFTDQRGRPRRPGEDTKRWREVLELAGIPYFRAHLTRHYAATLLAESGTSPQIAQLILGHASEAMTAYYTHIGTDATREPLENLARMISVRRR